MKKVFLASFIVVIALAAFFIPRRAAAKLPAPNAALPQGAPVISCNSNDGRRNYCPADTRGGVQLVNQRSNSACVFNRTWGFDARRIWVDRGCRADFQASYYGPGIPSFPGYPPGGVAATVFTARRITGGGISARRIPAAAFRWRGSAAILRASLVRAGAGTVAESG